MSPCPALILRFAGTQEYVCSKHAGLLRLYAQDREDCDFGTVPSPLRAVFPYYQRSCRKHIEECRFRDHIYIKLEQCQFIGVPSSFF